jgi:hypothetical protein
MNLLKCFLVGLVCQTIQLFFMASIPILGGIVAVGMGFVLVQCGVWCWVNSIAFGKNASAHFQIAWGLSTVMISLFAGGGTAVSHTERTCMSLKSIGMGRTCFESNNPINEIVISYFNLLGLVALLSVPICLFSGGIFLLSYGIKNPRPLMRPNVHY